MLKKACYCSVLAAAAFVLATQSAGARTLHVGTCKTAQTTYGTIQSAIDAAVDGDAVTVCPGTYPEQVSITKSVSLKGVVGMDAPQVVVPAGGLVQNATMAAGTAAAAQILVAPAVSGSANVTGLVVDAGDNNNTDCNLTMIGIYYKGAGGRIRKNTVQNQIGPVGHQGCLGGNGFGIVVENQTIGTDSVTIENNSVKNFDRNGIVLRSPGAVGTVARNTVTGLGETDVIAQNGIELVDGASANIAFNVLSGFNYTPGTFGSTAIILYNVSSALYQSPPTVQKNTINDANYGIAVDGANGAAGNLLQVVSNTISNTGFAGIVIFSEPGFSPPVNGDYVNVANNKITTTTIYDGIDVCGDNNSITRNTVANSSVESAIHLDALCEQANGDPSGADNTVSGNRITNACIGILSGRPQGDNTIGANKFVDVTNQTMFGSDDYACSTAHAAPQHRKAKGKTTPRPLLSP